MTANPEATGPLTPAKAGLLTGGFLSVWVVLLGLPMLAGRWLAGPYSDQYATGFAFRAWAAERLLQDGHVPQWNPELFGGLPFVAAQHGDIFYWTAWLRLMLPSDLVMNLGFVVHYVAAGVFAYLLLRLLGVSWLGSVVAGAAYQLSGVIGSYPAPGHDGKLFVTALLPLTLIALLLAAKRRWEGYGVLALAVGLALLSPHYQMAYYMLIAAGLFAIYLAFIAPETRRGPLQGAAFLGIAFAAVLVGLGVALIQVLPFYDYIPFSPRATGYYGFEGSTSYAVPWEHVPELFLSGFVGDARSYWGGNPLKLHSEYLGLPVVALAVLGVTSTRKRLVGVLAVIGTLFLLISLGSGTPFYRLWWSVMPFVHQTRAPGMALYVVAFVVAALAALGVEQMERGRGRRAALVWMVVGGVVTLVAAAGGVGGVARALASALPDAGRSVPAAAAAAPAIALGAALSGLALALVGAAAHFGVVRRERLGMLLLAIPLLIGGDLYRNARPFWTYQPGARDGLYAEDAVVRRLLEEPQPFRVLQVPGAEVYGGSSLMAFGIPQVLGHHGNELHRFDELMGGKNRWANLGSPRLLDLLAVRYVLVPSGLLQDRGLPGYEQVMGPEVTAAGVPADLYERTEGVRWARLVPGAVKVAEAQAIATVVDPRNTADPDRIVLLDEDAPLDPAPLDAIPEPLDVEVAVESWAPGSMRLRLVPAAPAPAYVVIGENWYPDWTARVDGAEAPVLRGNVSLLTVPVPAGAETLDLSFVSRAYARGKTLTLLSLCVIGAALVVPTLLRRMGRGI